MKKLFLFFTLSSILFSAFGQFEVEKYKSTEEEIYNSDTSWYKDWKPVEKSVFKKYHSKNYKINAIKSFSPYKESMQKTPYQDMIDSIEYNTPRDQKAIIPNAFIGKIDKKDILKIDKKGDLEIFIYTNADFEYEYGYPGVWVAVSKDAGENWSYYYTGLVQKKPVYVKWYSQLPLITDDGKIQIECALLRQIEIYTHPGLGPAFEVVKDGICVTFDLKKLSKDTDKDGLTDIMEDKFFTSPYKKDTDGDGIPDNLDLNPRFNYPRTEKSRIYETIINKFAYRITFDTVTIENVGNKSDSLFFLTDSTRTVLIVSDNPDILSVQPRNIRVIYLTKKEFLKYTTHDYFYSGLKQKSFSPMFKVDDMEDTYVMTCFFHFGSLKYLITKTAKGWRISLLYYEVS